MGNTRKRRARIGRRALGVGLALGALASSGGVAAAADDSGALLRPGAVFAMSNSPTGNSVIAFGRNADGTLTQAPVGRYPTGGTGSGTVENSANGLILGEQSPNNLGAATGCCSPRTPAATR